MRRKAWLCVALPAALLCCTTPPEPEPTAEASAEEAPAPFSTLADDVERQMQEQRAAAIARGAAMKERGELDRLGAARGGELDRELQEEREASAISALTTGCLRSEDHLGALGDLIAYRRLTRADFRARAAEPVETQVPTGGGYELGAHVSLHLLCALEVETRELRPGLFEARAERVKHFAAVDRRKSWWSPEATGSEHRVLDHEQLHFDLAELHALELNQDAERIRERTRGRGYSRDMALDELEEKWSAHMRRERERLGRVSAEYDAETLHGTDAARQAEWTARTKRRLLELQRTARSSAGRP